MKVSQGTKGSIAVVGLAFRFPGDLSDETRFWQALKEGRDLVTTIDSNRWATDRLKHSRRSEPGRAKTFAAGVLSRVDEFDAEFFGISPREAAWLDPQQRLLLELAWESMENGGIAPSALAGSDCSVFVGIAGVDYGMRAMDDLSSMTAHSMTGNTLSVAANRISYVFDLHGPSTAIDTACSSSLVALHHACNSLRMGESSMALVGGVNLLLHPYPFIGFTKASMLSSTGRCRAFDAAADGYVRAEGGAVFLLKPLENALADGDFVHAVILATGANADGNRKTGLTIPSCRGQVELMQSVLLRSGLCADEIDYLEAHGTGTAVGDPIESAAIGEVYGRTRSNGLPLPIGSVKTNLGHLEPASGMAGLAKAILMLKNRALAPSLHLVTPNPRIDFTDLNLEVVTSYRPLAENHHRKMVVGVNSFGFGGANAHVLLQEFRPQAAISLQSEPLTAPLFLSAQTPNALHELAGRYAETLKQHPQSQYDIAYSAAFRRDRLKKRLVLKAGSAADMAVALGAFAQGLRVSEMVLEDALAQPGSVAFIYSGNGSQWLGMGRQLMLESARFAELITGLDAPILARAGFSILEELEADIATSQLVDTAVAQPLLFSIQVALTSMLRESGVHAQAVAGHSVGEVAAAWAAGALSLDQAIEVICARSAAQAKTAGTGRMAAAGLSQEAAQAILTSEKLDTIEIAGINSPSNITLSGPFVDLERFGKTLITRGIFFRLLDLDYAFHSCAMDPIKSDLITHLAPLAPTGSDSLFVSTVTGEALAGTALDANYWWQNVRQPVQFAKAIAALADIGCRVFVEIGPHAILQRYISECLSAKEISGRVVASLRRDDDSLARFEDTVLRIHLLAEPPRLNCFFPVAGQAIQLPNYPWQRERHWHPRTSEANGEFDKLRVHPLLGWRLNDAGVAWENTLDPETCTWLADHQVAGAMVFPGAAYVEMALAAAREHFGGNRQEIEELDILAPIVFDGEHARTLRFELNLRDGGFQIRSRQRLSKDDWMLNAVGRLLGRPAVMLPPVTKHTTHALGEVTVIDRETHYRLTAALGLDYGSLFQGFEFAQLQGQTLLVNLALPQAVQDAADQYILHPALLDICFQSLVDFFKETIESGKGVPFLPVKVGRLRIFADAPIVQFRTYFKRRGMRTVLVDFELLDAFGEIVVALEGCRLRAASVQRKKPSEPACWLSVPHLKPRQSDQLQTVLPSISHLSDHLHAWFLQAPVAPDRSTYFKDAHPLFEALSLAFVHDAFAHMLVVAGDRLQQALNQPDTLDVNLQPYFRWMTSILQQDGLLTQSDAGQWQLESSGLPPVQSIWHTLLRDYPVALPELVLAAHLGNHLVALLQGNIDTAELSQSLLRSHQLDTLFDDSPTYLGTRLAVQHALHTLAADWPAHRRLRVLEVVAGTSALAQQLVDEFPAVALDYVIAHASEQAYEHLHSEYLGHPCIVVAKVIGDGLVLATDGTLPDQFDVIILRHTLHRANHPAGELAAAQGKLSSGGLLMLAERHADMAADFVFGLTPQWWHLSPSGQQVSCLTTPAVWAQALADQGFIDIGTFQEPTCGLAAGAYLLLAKRAIEHTVVEPEAAKWLLVAEATAPSIQLAESLQSHLVTQKQTVAIIDVATLQAAGQNALAQIDHVVYLASIPFTAFNADHGDQHVIAILQLVQAMAQTNPPARLWLVTAGGALVEGLAYNDSGDMQQGAIWGLGRVVMNEYPALQCTLIDLDIDPTSANALHQLQAELLHSDNEREIVLTLHGRLGLRMDRASGALPLRLTESAPRYRLDFRVPGQLRNLIWLPQPEPVLAPEDIEVRVVATGLNFRDIMYLMGLLPDEAVENGFAGASLGLEFSGVVTRVGQTGGEFSVGDAVMGFGSACFASHVVTQAAALSHKPASWSFESAATVPTVFFTVYYAFKNLANLQPGERVLIHGAAGGVGIAAVQLAQHLGAEIFATVGNEEKRDFVTLLGADHVLDSRSLAFADDILALTDDQGVDVVLNSLAGEAIRRNLRVLKPFGRFLELGKRDFFENTPIGLRPFKDNISYFGIDADQLLLARPALAGQLFREVMALFNVGTLFPLPYRVFDARHVLDAFRVMQQAQQIGKVVVKIDGAKVPVEPAATVAPKVQLGKDSTWLITGGLTGFGLASARWLAQRGAGHVILVGRRGTQTPGVTQAVAALKALGAQVTVLACDITDRAAVKQLFANIRQDSSPLTGILHAAMVLDDALIANLDAKRMRQVLAPKMLGAWHLHSLSQDIPLEHFVLYSSVTTSIGNPGQANYVAANAALEKLASIRRGKGLPATCIGWGPIGDAGYLTLNQAVKESLEARLGAAPLEAHPALAMLDRLLLADAATTTVANFDWPTLSRMLPTAQSPRFATLRRHAGPAAATNADDQDFQTLVAGKSPDEVRTIIQVLVANEGAQVLCVNVARVDPVVSLHDQGMDSLMGVELAMGLEKRFGIQLPTMMLSQGPTVERVTTRIVAQILASGEPSTADASDTKDNMDSVVALLAAQHGEEISADEMSRVASQAREQTRGEEATP